MIFSNRLPPLISYIFKRLLQTIPTLFGIVTINFLLVHLAPGDPLYAMVGEGFFASQDYMNQLRAQLGLDRPLYVQFLDYLWKILNGDLGFSFTKRTEVAGLVVERLGNTMLLVATSVTLSIVFGIALGFFAAKKPYSLMDNVLTAVSVVGYALPVFWVGQILITVFSLNLNWFPVAGTSSLGYNLQGLDFLADRLSHMVLPVTALTIAQLAFLTRLTRSTMLNVIGQDYMLTAKAKGLNENRILFRHGLRNALLPLVTTIGLRIGFIVSGALLVETVFAWPGIGRLTYEAIFTKDYPVIMGIFVITSTAVILMVLVVDILYAYIDPRIRYR